MLILEKGILQFPLPILSSIVCIFSNQEQLSLSCILTCILLVEHFDFWLQKNEGTPIHGFMLHYKPEFGDWDVAQIPYGADEFTLDDLLCGQRYHLYVTAYNDIGKVIFRSYPIKLKYLQTIKCTLIQKDCGLLEICHVKTYIDHIWLGFIN